MASEDIVLDVKQRTVLKKGLNVFRAEGKTPAVVHNRGKESLHISADSKELGKVYKQAGKHHPVQLVIDGKQQLAIIKDADIDPVKGRLRHIVFQAISQHEKVEAEVPFTFEGDAPAETAGLMVIKHATEMRIKALPKDLPDELKVDLSSLAEVGNRITVGDVVMPSGVEAITEPEHPIAVVEEPKVIEEEPEEAPSAEEEADAVDAATGGEGDEGKTEDADSKDDSKK